MHEPGSRRGTSQLSVTASHPNEPQHNPQYDARILQIMSGLNEDRHVILENEMLVNSNHLSLSQTRDDGLG